MRRKCVALKKCYKQPDFVMAESRWKTMRGVMWKVEMASRVVYIAYKWEDYFERSIYEILIFLELRSRNTILGRIVYVQTWIYRQRNTQIYQIVICDNSFVIYINFVEISRFTYIFITAYVPYFAFQINLPALYLSNFRQVFTSKHAMPINSPNCCKICITVTIINDKPGETFHFFHFVIRYLMYRNARTQAALYYIGDKTVVQYKNKFTCRYLSKQVDKLVSRFIQ